MQLEDWELAEEVMEFYLSNKNMVRLETRTPFSDLFHVRFKEISCDFIFRPLIINSKLTLWVDGHYYL